MSQKMSVGALAPQASLHAVARGKSAYLSRRLRAGVLSIGVLFLLIKFLTFLTGPPMLDIHIDLNGYSDAVDPDDIWDELPTLPYLSYSPCYSDYQCARLELPLDHFNGTTNTTISLSVIRKPAIVPVTSPNYGGAIMMNPGGPGGSGVRFMSRTGDAMRVLLDSPTSSTDAKFYDLISFDPRGLGHSRPSVHCFADIDDFRIWSTKLAQEGTLTSSEAALSHQWAMMQSVGRSCAKADSDDIKRYVSTAFVAADLLALTEAHGTWREREAARLISARTVALRFMPQTLRHRVGEEKIQYYGFSYGTTIGATFAAMYPDRVERFVLDGVMDVVGYITGPDKAMVDIEKALGLFFHHCARVGPVGCAFADEGMTAANISKRYEAVVDRLRDYPLPVVGTTPDIITYSILDSEVFVAMYNPVREWPLLALLLANIEAGQKVGYIDQRSSVSEFRLIRSGAGSEPDKLKAQRARENQNFLQAAVICSDSDPLTHLFRTDFQQRIARMEEQSPHFGALEADVYLPCTAWPTRPVHRYAGPWHGNTSHPILWVGNTADPVTPLPSARRMSMRFPGSGLLTVDGPGHCSVAAPSLEAVQYIRRYFHTGELPPEGTVCEPFSVPFGLMPNETVEAMPPEAMLEGAKIMAAPIVAQQKIAEGLGHAGLHLARGLAR